MSDIEREWFTAEELAETFRWTPAYVLRLASDKQWRRTGRAPTRFYVHDAYDHWKRAQKRPTPERTEG